MCPESSVDQPSGGVNVKWPAGSMYGVGSAASQPKNGSRKRPPKTSAESSRLDQRPSAECRLRLPGEEHPPLRPHERCRSISAMKSSKRWRASCGPGEASGWYCTEKAGSVRWRIPSLVRS